MVRSTSSASRSAAKAPLSRSLRLYERIAIGFVVVTVVLLLAVLYLSVARATIKVVAAPKEVSVTATADVTAAGGASSLMGLVKTMTLERARIFNLPGEGATPVPAKSSGYVTLKNESGSAQPLVATTRLLSPGGVLFRLETATTVPARGEVRVLVKADQPGQAGDIGPSRFTIPGLNDSQQKVIYGQSSEPMAGGVQYLRTLTEADVASAVNDLTEAIRAEVMATLEQGVDRTRFDGVALELKTTAQKTDLPVGQVAGAVEVTLNVAATAVFYQSTAVNERAAVMLGERVPTGFVLSEAAKKVSQIKIVAADPAQGTARIAIDIGGTAYLGPQAEALRVNRFLGRSPGEVETLLRASEDVRDVNLSFTPFWLKRVPTLEDHVEVIIVPDHE